jgi:hypothetical protein
LPRDLVADEKLTRVAKQQVYVPTTVGGGCFLGVSVVEAADTVTWSCTWSCMHTVRVIPNGAKQGKISLSITSSKGLMMHFDLVLYLVAGVFLFLLVLLPHWRWRRRQSTPAIPKPTRDTREPKPFAGYTRKPECEICASGVDFHPQVPSAPPPRMIFTRGRRHHIDTTGHFCPHAECAYHGRVDWGNIRANGHPNG